MLSQTVNKREVEFNAGESQEFTISDNVKIFHMLISGLYENKIQSITREVWSNAYDSHIEAGISDRPFRVTLPTAFDATFRVRDFGVSLTHEQVLYLYTSLGFSTKENKEAPIGKWGIGSKAPFSYSDTFTVTTYLNGKMRVYSAVIGADGRPAIHAMGEMDTTEENGLEVSFPVAAGDVRAFREAARRVGFGFDLKPEVVNDADFGGWIEGNVALRGDGWTIYSDNPLGYNSRTFVRMGPVLYPVNQEALENHLNSAELALLQHTVVLDVPMGSVEPTPSREGLQYGKQYGTIPTIVAAVKKCVTEMTQKALQDIENAPTKWEAKLAFVKTINNTGIPLVVRDAVKASATWQGVVLDNMINIKREPGFAPYRIPSAKLHHKTFRFIDDGNVKGVVSEHTVFVLEDLTVNPSVKRVGARIKHMVTERNYVNECGVNVIWIRFYGDKAGQNATVRFVEEFDGAEMIMAGDLYVPPLMAADRGPVKVREVHGYSYKPVHMSAETFEEGGYFVKIERDSGQENFDICEAVKALYSMGILNANETVYAAPKTLWNRFEKAEQWTPLAELLQGLRATEKDIQEIRDTMIARESYKEVVHDSFGKWVTECFESKHFIDPKSPLLAFSTWFSGLETEKKEMDDRLRGLQRLESAMGNHIVIDTKDDAVVKDYVARKESVKKLYPMLNLIRDEIFRYSYGSNEKKLDKVREYVNMCDKLNAYENQAAVESLAA